MHAGHTLLFQTLQSVIQSIGWRRRQEDDYQRWKDFVVSNRRDLRLRDNLGINDAFRGVRHGKRMITILHNFANQQLTLPCPATFAGCTCCSPTSSVKTLDLWRTDEILTQQYLCCVMFSAHHPLSKPVFLSFDPFVSFLVVSSARSKRIMSCHVHKMLAGEEIPNNSKNIAM